MLCADDNFVAPLAVALRSLADSQSNQPASHVTVLSMGISPENRTRLERSAEELSLSFVSVDDEIPQDAPAADHLTRAAYGRLKGVERLPRGTQRAVYLDADVIVREDLEFLFSVDLEGSPVAAVQDVGAPHAAAALSNWRDLGLSPTTPYMNTGVLVIDVEKWRAMDLGATTLEFAMRHRDTVRWADQDALNGVLAGDFARLPLRWNQGSSLRSPTHFGYSFFAEAEVDEAIRNPAIIHFCGVSKPWHKMCTDSAAADWLNLLGRTEFRGVQRAWAQQQGACSLAGAEVPAPLRVGRGAALRWLAPWGTRRGMVLRDVYRRIRGHPRLGETLSGAFWCLDRGPVFFVQIGSHTGATGDVVTAQIDAHPNWRGIMAEPVPEHFEYLCETRGNDPRMNAGACRDHRPQRYGRVHDRRREARVPRMGRSARQSGPRCGPHSRTRASRR